MIFERNFEKKSKKIWWLNKGSYLCTPLEKTGSKKDQKIFESLEATARFD